MEANVVWATDDSDLISFKTPHKPWNKIPGYFKQVEVGKLGAFAVDRYDNFYYRAGSRYGGRGDTWQKIIAPRFKHFSVGENSIWGVDENFDEIGYHGAGSRYFDNTRLAEKCLKFLPNKVIYDFKFHGNLFRFLRRLFWEGPCYKLFLTFQED